MCVDTRRGVGRAIAASFAAAVLMAGLHWCIATLMVMAQHFGRAPEPEQRRALEILTYPYTWGTSRFADYSSVVSLGWGAGAGAMVILLHAMVWWLDARKSYKRKRGA